MGLTFITVDKIIMPVILCDTCGERLYAGNALILWSESGDVKFICKGVEKCDKYPNHKFEDTIETYFYKLCYNSKLGMLKKSKIKW